VDRFWSRVGVRAAAVGLLLAGLAGGVYLGQDRDGRRGADSSASIVRVDDARLLRQRQSEHAAARALQRRAEGEAAQKAATEARAAAANARRLETRVVAARKVAADARKAAAAKRKAAETGGPVPYTGRIPDSCTGFSGSRAVGCTLMLNAGFEIDEFPCLNKLWNRESGWNYRAGNRGSGAYGIPQALPGTKMASAGADWKTSPATQIKWGLGYIKDRYHTPCAAWSHTETVGSY
jgi:hypothetical protein